jgi:transaldolase
MRVAFFPGVESGLGFMPNVPKGPQTADRELVREEFRRARKTDAREREPAPVAPSRWHDLAELGQSVWYDNVARPALASGLLERLIAEDHVTGGTSNPSIFAKAVLESDLYDEEFAAAPASWSPEQIFERCAIADIRRAADLLRPVWERTRGADGYVSIEEEASVAFDETLAVRRGHELKALVDRANVMIKVPGTPAGVAAFRRLTREGVSVNVTLLFSRERYREVAEAYVDAISERAAAGEDVSAISSVASFFVSRIDAKADALLDEGSPLRGTIAVANAKLAYADVFEPVFSSQRWRQLRCAGANVQRPLWASTGTKDPNYRPTLYIEELIGPETVTTAPDATIDAFRTDGAVAPTLTAGIEEARERLASLAEQGVDLDEITAALERDGVEQFARAYEDMIAAIAEKRARA